MAENLTKYLNQYLTFNIFSYFFVSLLLLLKKTSFKEKELTLEKLENHEDELIQLMHEKFLAGYDQGFIDYHEIDDNE
jgi:hypothetical protein